jgi:hypothetical protein
MTEYVGCGITPPLVGEMVADNKKPGARLLPLPGSIKWLRLKLAVDNGRHVVNRHFP